jgi:hypothetical protein
LGQRLQVWKTGSIFRLSKPKFKQTFSGGAIHQGKQYLQSCHPPDLLFTKNKAMKTKIIYELNIRFPAAGGGKERNYVFRFSRVYYLNRTVRRAVEQGASNIIVFVKVEDHEQKDHRIIRKFLRLFRR